MKVLFTTTPGWGHVHPMVPLAQAFLERGDEVAWAAATQVCDRLAGEGFLTFTAGQSEAENRSAFRSRYPELNDLRPQERPLFMFPRLFGRVEAPPMLEDLLPVVRDWQPALIVRDAADFAAPVAAAIARIPCVTHAFGGVLPRERLDAAATAVAPLWEAHGLEPRPFGGSYDHLYLDIYPPSLHADAAEHIAARQPLRPVPYAAPGNEPLPRLITGDSSTPLVYVTFGTLFNDASLIRTVVEGVRTLPVRVLVTAGPGAAGAGLDAQPPNVHVAGYLAQTRFLDRCDVVVSHAGSGTVLATLGHGIPQLCLPQAADQFENAAACARSGAGRTLPPGSMSVESVRQEVESLLADPEYRVAATALKEEMAAMPGPDAVAGILARRYGRDPR